MASLEFRETGEIPTSENPIVEVGDELRVNIENVYCPTRGKNPVYNANPVHVMNFRDFNIDRDGNFFIPYERRLIYGHLNDDGVFITEPEIVMEGAFSPMRVRGLTTSSLNYGIHSIEVVPGNFIKVPRTNEGILKTPGFPPSKYAGKDVLPMYSDRVGPHTMEQIKDFIKYSRHGLDLDIMDSRALKRILNLGLYGIYHNNSKRLYLKYEFMKAVFTDAKRKTQGYLVFRRGEPLRKRELSELSPLVTHLHLMPSDNPASMIGSIYREGKESFERRERQLFEKGEQYEEVLREMREKKRRAKTESAKRARDRVLSDIRRTRRSKSTSKSASRSRSKSRSPSPSISGSR
jgi:hypothetical protein